MMLYNFRIFISDLQNSIMIYQLTRIQQYQTSYSIQVPFTHTLKMQMNIVLCNEQFFMMIAGVQNSLSNDAGDALRRFRVMMQRCFCFSYFFLNSYQSNTDSINSIYTRYIKTPPGILYLQDLQLQVYYSTSNSY